MTTPCIEAEGTRRSNGYVSVSVYRFGKRIRTAHVLALIDALGRPLRDGYQANHACDNRACISTAPGHIYEGTQSQNIREAVERGHHHQTRKTQCPQCGGPFSSVIDHGRTARACLSCRRAVDRKSTAAYRKRKCNAS